MAIRLTEEDLQDPAKRRQAIVRLDLAHEAARAYARADVNSFARYVFGHRQHPFHRELQGLYSAHEKLCVDAPVEHGKTTQTVIRICWEIGRNPDAMFGYFSNSSLLPERVVRVVRSVLRHNRRYREVFPGIEIAKETNSEIWVKRHGGGMHPTLVGLGVGGSIIGSRLTHLVLDDILDFANTYSDLERRKLWDLLQSTILNRLLAGGRLWDIGTPWHVLDARHQLRRMDGVTFVRFDATRGTSYDYNGKPIPLPNGDPRGLWSEPYRDPTSGQMFGWPPERLEAKRRQLPALEFDRQFRCIASAGSLRIFDPEAIANCLRQGRGFRLPAEALAGDPVLSGVDLAVSRESYADRTVIHTGTVRELAGGIKYLPLDIRRGRWEVTQIFAEFRKVLQTYPNHLGFTVENNQAQDYLHQMLKNDTWLAGLGWSLEERSRLRVRPFTTTAGNKWSPVIGVRAMAADFEQGRFILPADEHGLPLPELQPLIDGLLGFDPSGHTSDDVMALWLWMEQARRYGAGAHDLWALAGLA